MLAIKLQRIGKKHQPSYRLVVAVKKSKMIAPPVEDLGSYNSFVKAASFKKDRISYWIGVGAQPTTTVHNLLVAQGIISSKKLPVKMKKAVAVVEPVPTASSVPVEPSKTKEATDA
jgi:small subunit ribosomal protein S16